MLDDLKMIHARDAQDALGLVAAQHRQLNYECSLSHIDTSNITNIIYAGMGSSALAANMSQQWPGYNLPFEVIRDYDIPAYVSPRTLCIASSYSGNTEETLSAVKQAMERGAMIVVIAGGGELADVARDNNFPLLSLPRVVEPRFGLLYNFKALITVMQAADVVAETMDVARELQSAVTFLESSTQEWLPEIPTSRNPAKQIAQEMMGRSVVIYSGPRLAPAAYKWKIGVNENAKQVAWTNQYPEFSHNEFVGWSKQPVDKPYAVIELRSRLDHPRIQKRYEITERLLSGLRPAPLVIEPKGETLFQQMLWVMVLGDFTGIYLGLLNGINPAPVALAEKFKKEMSQ